MFQERLMFQVLFGVWLMAFVKFGIVYAVIGKSVGIVRICVWSKWKHRWINGIGVSFHGNDFRTKLLVCWFFKVWERNTFSNLDNLTPAFSENKKRMTRNNILELFVSFYNTFFTILKNRLGLFLHFTIRLDIYNLHV